MKKAQLIKLLRKHPAPWIIKEGTGKLAGDTFAKGTLYSFDANGKSIESYQEYAGWPSLAVRLRGIVEAINIAAEILKKT